LSPRLQDEHVESSRSRLLRVVRRRLPARSDPDQAEGR
jgi:hypothetical protein